MSTFLFIALSVAAVLALACMASVRLRSMSGRPASSMDELRSETWRETERLYCVGLESLRNDEFERAARDLGLAAERGHARAQLYFGVLREQGLGLQADLESARQWYRRAAAQGDADAYSRLRVISDTEMPIGPRTQSPEQSSMCPESEAAVAVQDLADRRCSERSTDAG